MKIKLILILSILFAGDCWFLIQAMEKPIDPINLSAHTDNELRELEHITVLAICLYDEFGVEAMVTKLVNECPLEISMRVCEKLFTEFKRRDVVIALLLYKFRQNNDEDIELNVYLLDLFYKVRDNLEEAEAEVLHGIWKRLSARLEEILKIEQKKLDSTPILDLKAKEIIANFNVFQLLKVGRFYDSPQKRAVDDISENSEGYLKQIVMHIFTRFDKYLDSPFEAIELIEFLFPGKIDSEGNNIVNIIVDNLRKCYPRLTYLAGHYNYLLTISPGIMKLIAYLPTVPVKCFAK